MDNVKPRKRAALAAEEVKGEAPQVEEVDQPERAEVVTEETSSMDQAEDEQEQPSAETQPEPEADEAIQEDPTASSTPHEAVLRGAMEVTDDDLEMIYVNAPKDFKIRMNHTLVISILKGPQRLERVLAEHWYSKAHGVELIK